MEDVDILKIAFRAQYGHYEFLFVHFILTNALVDFMRSKNNLFWKYLYTLVLVFIFQNEEHKEHLQIVLQKSREHKLYTKLSRFVFLKKEV